MNNYESNYFMSGVILGIVLGFIFTMIGCSFQINNFKKEAVKQGHAHWSVQENGDTVFTWNASCKAPDKSLIK